MLCTLSQRKRLIAQGYLVPVRQGVYRLAGAEPDWYQKTAAVGLVLPPDAVVSHRCAARWWGLTTNVLASTEVVSQRKVACRGVRNHVTVHLDANDVTVSNRLPVTRPARTLLDCAGVLSLQRVEELVEAALNQQLVTTTELATAYEAYASPGKRRTRHFAMLLDGLQSKDGVYKSKLERRVLGWLAESGFPAPVAQQKIVAGGVGYHLDFAYPAARVAIEADSFRWHASSASRDLDAARDLRLARIGWRVLRVTWHTHPGLFLDSLRSALQHQSA